MKPIKYDNSKNCEKLFEMVWHFTDSGAKFTIYISEVRTNHSSHPYRFIWWEFGALLIIPRTFPDFHSEKSRYPFYECIFLQFDYNACDIVFPDGVRKIRAVCTD